MRAIRFVSENVGRLLKMTSGAFELTGMYTFTVRDVVRWHSRLEATRLIRALFAKRCLAQSRRLMGNVASGMQRLA